MSGVQRVVVGFDGSESARAALAWAVAEARLHEACLEVWTVIEPPPRGTPDEAAAGVAEELRVVAERITEGVRADFRVSRGGAASELCAACAESDLLVVGSRGRSPFAGLLLGSVSRACLHHARGSVAVVPAPSEPASSGGAVLVGIDTSGHSRHALLVAAQEARLRGAELQVIHAVHWDHMGVELIEPTTEQLVTWGESLIRTELAAAGVEARSMVLPGRASDVLVGLSAEADLLVLGSRGHNALAALALGSTSDHCVRQASCPVLVVRPDAADSSPTEG